MSERQTEERGRRRGREWRANAGKERKRQGERTREEEREREKGREGERATAAPFVELEAPKLTMIKPSQS